MGRVRSPKRRVRDDDFIVGLSSDILESSFYWWKHFKEFPLKSWASRFRGRRSIWWGWRVTLLAPRIGNDVSYVRQIPDDLDIVWQAQYLARLAGDFTFVHWKWRFICEADPWWLRYCVAGAVFGEVGGWLHFLCALEMKFHMSSRSLMMFILRGRRNIWWCWRVTLLAPRIGNDVSYVTQIIDDILCVTYETSFPMRGASKVTLQHQQILRLPRKMNVDCTELLLLLYWCVTLRNYYFAELLVYRSITLRIYYFTDLLLYWCVTLRN